MAFIYTILQPLKVDLGKKILVFALFSLGLFSLMCNMAKAVVFWEKPFTPGYIWATTEISVAIICASIPMLRPLFTRQAWIKGSGSGWRKLGRSPAASKLSFPQLDVDISPVHANVKLRADP